MLARRKSKAAERNNSLKMDEDLDPVGFTFKMY